MLPTVRLSLIATALLTASPLLATNASTDALDEFNARQQKLAALGDTSTRSKSLADRIFVDAFETGGPDVTCAADSDGDGLPDCAETGTGIFVDATDSGTDPLLADTDGDGLSDGEEVLGTLDGLDLPALGVNPLRKDLLVEYDWFEHESNCGVQNYRPSAEIMQRVAAVFAQAPVQNPDGSTGIHVIQDSGQGGALAGGNQVEGYSAVLPGALSGTYYAIREENFAPNRLGYFHYSLMVHQYNNGSDSSGYAEVVGDDMIISLGCFQSVDNVSRTIVHELGHNLGLHHGGFEACNGKPNYNSLMNYRYQFSGLDATCSASGDGSSNGFSAGDRLDIDEARIDEALGVCGDPAIDWNHNGSLETGIALDLNPGFAAECGGTDLHAMHDFDDWANITLLGLRDHTGQLKSIKQETACAGAPAR